ncbi:translational GTPase TypA [Candidatus Peregrinibacteria bacterium]|nr:translational GTPase TypA [Candidatus Peregrinibacteria bacterium]
MEIRNIAIIAHVDHGKTTLVDALLKAGGAFTSHERVEERVMDSYAQEKERGITIYAKNAAITYKDTKINIVDTPGHADFGSEVERMLRTIDATVLLVDALEGPMPQTKFVLSKALALGLPVLVVINKIDRPMAQPDKVLDLTFDLFGRLNATEKQMDFPYIYTIAREGIAIKNLKDERKDITPLLDWILEHVKPARADLTRDFRMQPATLAYDNYVGRIAIGRVHEGSIKAGTNVFVVKADGSRRKAKITKVFTFHGLKRTDAEKIVAGDIVAIAGISDVYVGETITTSEIAEPLPAIKVDPPALQMDFMVNTSPFAGREGALVTSRHLRERLLKELETNVGLKVEMHDNTDTFKVYGRGEMHLSVLIEAMRREGFELQVSQPQVVTQTVDGVLMEPVESAAINVPDAMAGKVIEAMAGRKGELKEMLSQNGNTIMEFHVPTRGLLGFTSAFILMTRGEGTFYHAFDHFAPHYGVIDKRSVGSMISGETGVTVAYALWFLQERGPLFVAPGEKVYEGMIIGEHNQGTDLVVNPMKEKKLSNMRASGSDEAIRLTPPQEMNLEKALEYIQHDEYVEVTPQHIRLRKKFLTELDRKRHGRK